MGRRYLHHNPDVAGAVVDEEKALASELPGYAAYAQKVRWRLMPGVW